MKNQAANKGAKKADLISTIQQREEETKQQNNVAIIINRIRILMMMA